MCGKLQHFASLFNPPPQKKTCSSTTHISLVPQERRKNAAEQKGTSVMFIKHNEIKSIRAVEKLKTSKKGLYKAEKLRAANAFRKRRERPTPSNWHTFSQINVNFRFHQNREKKKLQRASFPLRHFHSAKRKAFNYFLSTFIAFT